VGGQMALKIYIGGNFKHTHETEAAKDLSKLLYSRFENKKDKNIVVMFNLLFSTKIQVDCLIFTPGCIFLIDFKSEKRPFSTKTNGYPYNGYWNIIGTNEHLKAGQFNNPFQQINETAWDVFGCINRLTKNFLSETNLRKKHYGTFKSIYRLIVFHPELNKESEITINLKSEPFFLIVDWKDVPDLLINTPHKLIGWEGYKITLSMEEMIKFAEVLNLIEVDSNLNELELHKQQDETTKIIKEEISLSKLKKEEPVSKIPSQIEYEKTLDKNETKTNSNQVVYREPLTIPENRKKIVYPVYILLDTSDSMNSHNRKENMIEALNYLIQRIGLFYQNKPSDAEIFYKISIITFGGSAKYLIKDKIIEEIDEIKDIKCSGPTMLGKALDLLKNDLPENQNKGLIVLITDGAPSDGPTKLNQYIKEGKIKKEHFFRWKEFGEFMKNSFVKESARFAIGVGSKVCAPMLEAFAEGINAIHIENPEEIQNAITYVADSYTKKTKFTQEDYGIKNKLNTSCEEKTSKND